MPLSSENPFHFYPPECRKDGQLYKQKNSAFSRIKLSRLFVKRLAADVFNVWGPTLLLLPTA